jgi:hypothetical protein
MMLTGASLILSGYLMWGFAARDAPIVSGALIGLFLFGSEMLLEIGNAAGIEVSLCLIAVWCFMENRLVPAGIFCLALGVAAKPHVAGLVWLYFWLAGGVFRKRAGQTLAVVVIVSLPAAIWVWHTAPHWMGELSANLRSASMHGQVDDPGPSSVDPRQHGAIMISLQTVFSMYRDDPRFYNPLSYFVSGALLLVWVVTTIRVHFSRERAWLALATIAPLSMLPIYHRLHDTCLLLLVFPAFAAIWAAGGAASWIGLALTGAGTVLTGDFPVQQLAAYAARLQGTEMGIWAKTLAFVLERPVPLVLLSMSIFYLWAYARQTGTATAVNAEAGEGSASWVNGLGQE